MFRMLLMDIVLQPRWWFSHTSRVGRSVIRDGLVLYTVRNCTRCFCLLDCILCGLLNLLGPGLSLRLFHWSTGVVH